MSKLAALIVAFTVAVTSPCWADSYSTEATLILNKGKTQYEVAGRVCRLVERDGKLTEEVIARPKVVSTPGVSGSFYVGADRSDTSYSKEENVSMEVFWPKDSNGGTVTCTITVRRGDMIISKTTTKIQQDEP